MIRRLLIANRGEIAVRIIRACRDLGIETVQAYSEADAGTLATTLADRAVHIGRPAPHDSYLNPMAVIGAALLADCDAIHPGYGFLSENAAFARQCARNGLVFVGPSPEVIAQMGDKTAARRIARDADVPTVPGSADAIADAAAARAVADAMGYPVLIKAAAGGGGRGMRVVVASKDFDDAFLGAQSEAQAAFGDPRVYIERYLTDIRHVEVQLLGDAHEVVHFGERDCTIQRRHQKLVEETPSPALDAATRERLLGSAVRLARHVGYTSLGTVEYIFDNVSGEFYFIEMNTRLQVEHPVTEMVTGIDLVAEQIRIAGGATLRQRQPDIVSRGHAIECRLNAEDANRGFLPRPGTLTSLALPAGPWVRVDTHAFSGSEVTPYYDSMIAKVIAWGSSRAEAVARMRRALGECDIRGLPTNIALHREIMDDTQFNAGRFNTGFLETMPARAERKTSQ